MAIRAVLLIAVQPELTLPTARALKEKGLNVRIAAGPYDIIIDDVKVPTEADLARVKTEIEKLPGIKRVTVQLLG